MLGPRIDMVTHHEYQEIHAFTSATTIVPSSPTTSPLMGIPLAEP